MIEEATAKQRTLEVARMLRFFVPGEPQGRVHMTAGMTKDNRPYSRPSGSPAALDAKAGWRAM